MKKRPSQFIYYVDLFFDVLGWVLHYVSLLFQITLNLFSLWLIFIKIDFTFSLPSILGYAIGFSLFFLSVSFFIHHYIYIKNMNIDLDVIRGSLSARKALKIIKDGKNSPPMFRHANMFYMDFGALFVFKKSKRVRKYKDINIEEIPKNMQNSFSLFYIMMRLAELFFLLFLLIFLIMYLLDSNKSQPLEKEKTYTLKDAIKRVCDAKGSDGVYYYLLKDDNYIFTLDAPLKPKHIDYANAIYVDKIDLGVATRGSTLVHLSSINKSAKYYKCNNNL